MACNNITKAPYFMSGIQPILQWFSQNPLGAATAFYVTEYSVSLCMPTLNRVISISGLR